MSRFMICLLVSGALLMAGDKKGNAQAAQDLQKCKEKCAKSYDNCKKSAGSKSAIEGCTRSRDACVGACNK